MKVTLSNEQVAINKIDLLIRIADDLGLTYGKDVCKVCGADKNLETDHIHARNKLMDIASFQGYLHQPELQDFITAEIKKCQVLCRTCHNKSKSLDGRTERKRNLASTPWLVRKINSKYNYWKPTQIIRLLKLLGYQPGDTPRPLRDYKWKIYRSYAASINKPSINFRPAIHRQN